jgi:rhamnulokinase
VESTWLAFDLGATSWRAILGRERGGRLELEELARRANTPVAGPGGGLHWDLQAIRSGMLEVLGELAAARGQRPQSIGIDSWSIDYGLLDERGELLEAPRCYRDPRNLGMKRELAGRIGERELFRRTGLMAEDITTLCQLAAARRHTPQLLDRARRLLFIPDLLRCWLCGGAAATDFTLATTSQLYNLGAGTWDESLLAAVGLPARVLPEVRHGPQVLASLSPEAQAQTGLGPVPVTLGASHDTAAAFSSVPAHEHTAVLSSGTWSILGTHRPAARHLERIDPNRFGYEGNPDGTVRLITNIPGMWILERCLEVWRRSGLSLSYDRLVEGAAAAVAFAGRIDPWDPAFEAPEDMPEAIRSFCARCGQRAPRTPFETARAIFQGLARAYAAALGELEGITGRRFRRLQVIGGGSRNRLLNGFIAEQTGLQVVQGEAEATAVGNIRNQQKALRGPRA